MRGKDKKRFGTSKNFHVLCRMQKKVDLTPEAFNRLDEHHKKTKVEKKHFASEAIIEKLNKIGEKK